MGRAEGKGSESTAVGYAGVPEEPRFVPLEFERLEGSESLTRSQTFLAEMQRRRSVRTFSTGPVAYELIENAVATAGTAPSGAHQQPCVPDLERKPLDENIVWR
jgi:hypothetical protein